MVSISLNNTKMQFKPRLNPDGKDMPILVNIFEIYLVRQSL